MPNSFGSLIQSLEQVIGQFHFIRPLWLLVFIPLGYLLWLRWREDAKPTWKDVLPEHLRDALTIGEQGWRKQLPLKLLSVIMTIGVIVCAGPSWQREASPFGEDKASMMVVLANTDSMLEEDLAPNRLERSKHKIRDLIDMRNGGSTGLAVYAGSAHVAMPVTQDSDVFAPFLKAIQPEIMPLIGNRAESALPIIAQQLDGQLGATVLLVSDGVTASAIDAYATFFAENPYQLLILAPTSSSRSSATNPVDINSLERLASAANGQLVEITVDDQDVQSLNRFVERNMQMNGESLMPWRDMGYELLIPLGLIMLMWFRRGWLVQWCLIGAVSLPMLVSTPVQAEMVTTKAATTETTQQVSAWDGFTQWWWDLWLTPDQQGQRWFEKQEYVKAGIHYQDPLHKGVAYYYAREFKLAHAAFLQMEDPNDPSVKDFGLYNAASALARQREYVAARSLLTALAEKEDLATWLRPDVENNLAVISTLIDNINQFSESQMNTPEGPEESHELGENDPQTSDGVEEKVDEIFMMKETLNAEEILGSEDLANKWLKRVEADPKRFLRAKFQIQLLHESKSNTQTEKGDN